MIGMSVLKFRYKGLNLLHGNRLSIVLTLHDCEVIIQSFAEADGYVELATIDRVVPSDLGALIGSLMDRSHQALKVFPFFGI